MSPSAVLFQYTCAYYDYDYATDVTLISLNYWMTHNKPQQINIKTFKGSQSLLSESGHIC